MKHFSGKLALQQRVLPNYRAPFFELLASICDGGMSLFTGLPRPSEGITTTDQLRITNYVLGKNIRYGMGIISRFWLAGVLGDPVCHMVSLHRKRVDCQASG